VVHFWHGRVLRALGACPPNVALSANASLDNADSIITVIVRGDNDGGTMIDRQAT